MPKATQDVIKNTEYFIFLLLLTMASCTGNGEVFQDSLCINHITVIDAKNGMLPDMTVIIQEGRISHVKSSKDLKLSPANKIIDGSGKYMIPGLWDAHVHFAYNEELAPSMLKLFIAYGITSVRDTGGDIGFLKALKEACSKKPTETPRVMIAGPLIDGIPTVYDGSDPGHPPLSIGVNSVEDAVQAVDRLDSIGVDFIKAYEMLTPEQFRAIIDRSHEKGLKVTGHVPLSMDVISASNAGLNSMEHLRNLELSMASDANSLLKKRLKLLAQGKLDHGGKLRSKFHSAQRINSLENSDSIQIKNVLAV
jgi:imidazolonepropionase-like amidohydrolase